MKPPSKPILIAGGVALAVGAIWYIKKSEKPQEEFLPVEGPKTYASSQEASGNYGGFGGGGTPSGGTAPGTTTVPPKVGPIPTAGLQNESPTKIAKEFYPPIPRVTQITNPGQIAHEYSV